MYNRNNIQLFRERLSYKRGGAYATMSKVIMGNWDFTVPWLELKMFQRVKGNRANPCIDNLSFLLARHHEPPSSSAQLFLPIIPIGIIAYALTLLLDNLSRNSCMNCVTHQTRKSAFNHISKNRVLKLNVVKNGLIHLSKSKLQLRGKWRNKIVNIYA